MNVELGIETNFVFDNWELGNVQKLRDHFLALTPHMLY